MKKLILSVVIASFAILAQAQTAKTVSLEAKIPYQVAASTQFEMVITIIKPDFINYATFRQQLPEGFKAVEKESGTAIFNFENGFVSYKWLALPRNEKITLSYDVIPTSDMGKIHKIAGTFKYLSGNLQGEVSLESIEMKVLKKGSSVKFIKAGSINKDGTKSTDEVKKNESLVCSRAVPILNKKKEFTVNLKIKKENINSTAKIIERIPTGYTPQEYKSAGAVYEYNNGQVIFLWNKLPKGKTVKLSYKLIPNDKKDIKVPSISGEILYLKNGKLSKQAIN